MNTTASGDLGMCQATLLKCVSANVRARLSGLEVEAVHQIDIRLETMSLVLWVAVCNDLLQAKLLPKLLLDFEEFGHGW